MRFPSFPLLIALLGVVAACDDDDDIVNPQPVAQIRVVNASAPNQNVDLFVNGERVGSTSFAFGTASVACFEVPAGTRTVEFRSAGSSSALVRVTPDPSFTAGTSNTVLVTGAGANLRALAVPDAFAPASGQGGVRVIHASPALGRRDIFVTAPGVTISGDPTFEDVDFGTATSFSNVAAGDVRIRFTNPGSTVVAFDGNGAPAFNVPANQSRTFLITDVAGGGMPSDEDALIVLQACS
ncbi:MAG: DUF4397 domain-containing protein [Gemmatimonadaceae bacterium]